MNELIDLNPDVNVQEAEFKRLLGYPIHREMEGRSRELAGWARSWFNLHGKPWIWATKVDKVDFTSDKLIIGGFKFTSRKFRNALAKANAFGVLFTIVSAGKECEEEARKLWLEGKPDKYFFLEAYSSAVTEHLLIIAGARFCVWAEENELAVLPHYSPGYPGWDVNDQKLVFELIKQRKRKDLPSEFTILETGMLKPKKSLIAVFGITKEASKFKKMPELIPCEICSMFSCQYRRKPFKFSRVQTENAWQNQPHRNNPK